MRGGIYPNSATYCALIPFEIQNGMGTLNPNKLTMAAKGYIIEREREREREREKETKR